MKLVWYELAVGAFFALFFISDLVKRMLPTRRTKAFRTLIAMLMAASFMIAIQAYARQNHPSQLMYAVVTAIALYLQLGCCICYHCYVLAVIHGLYYKSAGKRYENVIFVAATVFILSTPWTGWFFQMKKTGEMQMKPLFMLLAVWLGMYLLYDIYLIWTKCRQYSFQRRVLCALLAVVFMIGIAVQTLGYPCMEMVSMMLLFTIYTFYLSLQSPDFYIDNAVGVFNRTGFFAVLRERMDYQLNTTCFLVRVRNFNSMVQIYGEGALKEVQCRIRDVLKEECTENSIYHIGASTFAVLLKNNIDVKELHQKMQKKILPKWDINGETVYHEYSYYYLNYPQDCEVYEELIQRLHYARSDHAGHHRAGELVQLRHDTVEEAEKRKKVAHLVEEAIMDNSIEIYFQPIYSFEKERITSLEVLSRLKDEDKNYINPEYFIHVAEENHTIIKLGEQIFRKACIFASQNHIFERGIEDININLSPVQCRYEGLTDSLVEIAAKYHIPMWRMHLEITESEFTDADAVGRTLKNLKKTGAKVALDDFGTGFSTLSNILELPVDYVKIDKSLVWSFAEGKNQFLNDLMPMIKAEGKKIIAEGIETQEHIDIIKHLGGDFLQGYYFSKPLPGTQFMRFLHDFALEKAEG